MKCVRGKEVTLAADHVMATGSGSGGGVGGGGGHRLMQSLADGR